MACYFDLKTSKVYYYYFCDLLSTTKDESELRVYYFTRAVSLRVKSEEKSDTKIIVDEAGSVF